MSGTKRATGRPMLTGRPDRTHSSVMEPPSLLDGQVRCPACRSGVAVTKSGALWRHHDLFGGYCGNVAAPADGEPLEAPDVVVPPPPREGRENRSDPSRLDVGSHCRECNRWLPGERSLCGRCSILQGRAR